MKVQLTVEVNDKVRMLLGAKAGTYKPATREQVVKYYSQFSNSVTKSLEDEANTLFSPDA